jgi:Xaa-Pro aminopeptidase
MDGAMLTPDELPRIQAALGEMDLDGWLLFDFHGVNPVTVGMLQLQGMVTRRIFVYVPRRGMPTAITHAIEQGPWSRWPESWGRVVYSGWRELEGALATLVRGHRIAMEYSPGDAVPYVDRVPAGVIEMVRQAGAVVVSSGELVSRFFAVWDAANTAAHLRAAEAIRTIAHDAFAMVGERTKRGDALTEFDVQSWIAGRISGAGMDYGHAAIVAIGPNAANPHYGPAEGRSSAIRRGDVLLIDLWGREPGQPFADQTWVGVLGTPDAKTTEVWEAVRDARDAAIAALRTRVAAGQAVRGADIDDEARGVIESRGYGKYFTHRTGHSIDPREIHGSGPHIDNLETREERLLIPGVGFSIEPGIYIPNTLGIRSEVNGLMGDGEVLITPSEYQRDLLII